MSGSKLTTADQAVYLGDSLSLAKRINALPVANALPQHIANLRTVTLNPENDINARRAAFTALERSGEPAAAAELKELSASGLTLEEPEGVRPRSPKHPDGIVTGATN